MHEIVVRRWSVLSKKPFEDVLASIQTAVGHPDMNEFSKAMAASATYADIEKLVARSIGRSGLMEFIRFDLGAVLRKAGADPTSKSIRLVLGNPLIMQSMARHAPDAASYAPITVLIDERPDGVHLSYDEIASLLAPYGTREAIDIAQDLDGKVKALLTEAA
jgi:uncharacterized protein (DUF302 family)